MASQCGRCGSPLSADYALYCSQCGAPATRQWSLPQLPEFSPGVRVLASVLGLAVLLLAVGLVADATFGYFTGAPGTAGAQVVAHRLKAELTLLLAAAGSLVALVITALCIGSG